jgi:phage tail-like protein
MTAPMDPYPAFNFTIALVDTGGRAAAAATGAAAALQAAVVGAFSQCSGLEGTVQPEEYREGGWPQTHRFPRHVTWGNLRLRRGVTLSDDLWNWYAAHLRSAGRRRDGVITVLDDIGVPVKAWRFTRGFPVRWTGPTLDAAVSAVAFEELEIAHDGLDLYAPSAVTARVTGGFAF